MKVTSVRIPKKITEEIQVLVSKGKFDSLEDGVVKLISRSLAKERKLNFVAPEISVKDEKREVWKLIKGFSNYQVSSLGRVRNLARGSYCTISTQTRGYGFVSITGDEGNRKQVLVHTLVAKAFLKMPKGKYQVNHKDGNRKNNRKENLEWTTQAENAAHSVSSGLRHKAGKHWRAKFTENEVKQIRAILADNKGSISELAEKYGVSSTAIRKINNRESWMHI